jgi:hypothetical protein
MPVRAISKRRNYMAKKKATKKLKKSKVLPSVKTLTVKKFCSGPPVD